MGILKLGNSFAGAYVVVMALSVVWISRLQNSFHESFMLLVVSASALILYNLVCIKSLKQVYRSIGQAPAHWFLMSVSFAMTWWLIYYSTIYASPRAVIVVFYLVVALFGCLSDKQYLYSIFCILALCVAFYLLPELKGYTALTSILCGFFGYLYMRSSGKYAALFSLSTSQILAIRFYILFLISLAYVMFVKPVTLSLTLNQSDLSVLLTLLLLVVFNLLPNYCAQRSIILVGANNFSKLITFTPVVTYIFQGLSDGKWDIKILVLCVCISALLNTLVNMEKT